MQLSEARLMETTLGSWRQPWTAVPHVTQTVEISGFGIIEQEFSHPSLRLHSCEAFSSLHRDLPLDRTL